MAYVECLMNEWLSNDNRSRFAHRKIQWLNHFYSSLQSALHSLIESTFFSKCQRHETTTTTTTNMPIWCSATCPVAIERMSMGMKQIYAISLTNHLFCGEIYATKQHVYFIECTYTQFSSIRPFFSLTHNFINFFPHIFSGQSKSSNGCFGIDLERASPV